MDSDRGRALREASATKQQKMVKQWQAFSNQEAYKDLISYIDDQREMLRQYAEDRAMPHPNPIMAGKGEVLALDNETVAGLLQNSRGLNIVKTYIELRVNHKSDVVLPTKPTK